MEKFCRYCGNDINEYASYCTACGVKKGQRDTQGNLINNFCFNCGEELSPYQSMCINCGTQLNKNTATDTATEQKSLWKCFTDSWNIRTEGTATRREFWGAYLFHFIFAFTYLYLFVAWLPLLFLQIRRAHDAGYSGWVIWIPYFNFVVLFLPTKYENNKYRID